MTGPRRGGERRSLTNVGGPTETRGDEESARLLAHALDVSSSVADGTDPALEPTAGDAPPADPAAPTPAEAAARAHVHGFHTYPARMHPTTARRLIEALSAPGETVLDPFCGSGTVLVEARAAGRKAIGVDLNPLAVRLARRKVEPAPPRFRDALVTAAREVQAMADSRRKARVGASRRYPPEDVAAFDPHVLLELDGLRVGLDELRDGPVRADLELVLSSILVKVSRRTADTAEGGKPPRIAAGFTAKTFVRKAEELAARLAEIDPALRFAPAARVIEGDARLLPGVEPGSVQLVVTSPPYAGVYDYVEHHRTRLRWLGLDPDTFEAQEIGSRRAARAVGPARTRDRYRDETLDVLDALAEVLAPDGRVVWLVGDGAVADEAIAADRLLEGIAHEAGFRVRAIASQDRQHFDETTRGAFARRPRREHAILLVRAPDAPATKDPRHASAHRERAPAEVIHRGSAPRGPRGRGPRRM